MSRQELAGSANASNHDGEEEASSSGDGEWEDLEPDEENISVISLFSDLSFPDVPSMLQHCKDEHAFDLVKIRYELDLDQLELMKLVNYVRSEVKKGNGDIGVTSKSIFEDEKYLRPVLEDDALLYSLTEVPVYGDVLDRTLLKGTVQGPQADIDSAAKSIIELQEELQYLQLKHRAYQEAVDIALEKKWDNETQDSVFPQAPARRDRSAEMSKSEESQYFTSYSYNEIHETMLKDTVRTDAYRDFIYGNKNLFRGKTVLDVGCGTGILSMFCAKAGAAKVIAVDNSDIIDKAKEIILDNGMGGIIVCIRGKIEEVSLPVSRVDIIVSEWMGYCLLYEAMLDSVLWARDRYLAPDGLMVPSHVTLFVAPLADPDYIADHVSFWRSVYGFKMDRMLAHIYDEVLIRDVQSTSMPGSADPFYHIDLYAVSSDQLQFKGIPFSVKLTETIDNLDGFVIWFDTFFLPSKENSQSLKPYTKAEEWAKSGRIAFTTGPAERPTHWRQGVLLIDHGGSDSEALEEGVTISGTICYKKGEDNQRTLDIELGWDVKGIRDSGKQTWSIC